ncbi:acetate--CoA ligase family protein [soil metagenome]
MARLHEYQGKALLAQHGFAIPRGGPASTPEEAAAVARSIGGPCVIKIQAWMTGRAAIGGIAFADTPEQAADHAKRLLAMKVGSFPITSVLVEEKVSLARELFVSLSINDRERMPMLLLSLTGGSGIEERAGEVFLIPCDVKSGPDAAAFQDAMKKGKLDAALAEKITAASKAAFETFRAIEARSLEINPLGVTTSGEVVACDCRVTVDDYAVFRHPELGIDVARELDHPPTALERVAYTIEQDDHRGTFYFAQLATAAAAGTRGLVGFHGAGGGGSMMSMDAITNENFTIANFTDTSGNPSAAKVYRAARIILSQPGLIGYFGSGSGVASQEQFWSAYGLAKAFWELELTIPAVVRMGGNSEDRAVDILQRAAKGLPTTVEGYKKSDPPAVIAKRFADLVAASKAAPWKPHEKRKPAFVTSPGAFSFPIKGGRVFIDAARWNEARGIVLSNASNLLRDDKGKPALAVTEAEIAGKDSEMIACEVECRSAGVDVVYVDLEMPAWPSATE